MNFRNVALAVAVLFVGSGTAVAAEAEADLHNIEDAVEKAKKEEKNVLVNFTGSDWCTWCIRLHDEVFNSKEWKDYAGKNVVTVVLDFPRDASKIPPEQLAYNKEKAGEYGVQGYPTILLLDAEGKELGRTGYRSGGPENYISHIEGFLEIGRAVLRTKRIMEQGSKEKKLDALADLFEKLEKAGMAEKHIWVLEKLVELDVDDSKGHRAEWAGMLALHHYEKDKEKSDSYMKIAREDPGESAYLDVQITIHDEIRPLFQKKDVEKAREELEALRKPDLPGKALQVILEKLAYCEYLSSDREGAIRLLKEAVEADPGTPMAASLRETIENLEGRK